MRTLAWVGLGSGITIIGVVAALGRIVGHCVDAFINSEEPDVGDEVGDWFPSATTREV